MFAPSLSGDARSLHPQFDGPAPVALMAAGGGAAAGAAVAAAAEADAEAAAKAARTRTTRPIVTGTSVLGVKFKGGVMLCADTLGSYGSLARFKSLTRIRAANECTVVGAGGDYSDFQLLARELDSLATDEFVRDDGHRRAPAQIHSWMSRVMYHARNKFDPLWLSAVVAGYDAAADEPFLGYADLQGSNYTDDYVATGYGAYLALGQMRDGYSATLDEAGAKALLTKCMTVLLYRDARTINRVQFATVTKQRGVEVADAVELETKWDAFEHVQHGGSW
mmetsp:Transcript_35518/g.86870  ORF Transcript_35518/g.86870 Transcript_35518/m.86870 type:complete len:279 (-) Transcript_35518:81-917(-)